MRTKKQTPEDEAADLWDLAVKLRSNGQKVDLVVDCEHPGKVNPILEKLTQLYGTKKLYVVHVFPKEEWRLREDDSKSN